MCWRSAVGRARRPASRPERDGNAIVARRRLTVGHLGFTAGQSDLLGHTQAIPVSQTAVISPRFIALFFPSATFVRLPAGRTRSPTY